MFNILRRMWIRRVLRWNNICPEHGPMEHYDSEFGCADWCSKCLRRKAQKHVERLERMEEEYHGKI